MTNLILGPSPRSIRPTVWLDVEAVRGRERSSIFTPESIVYVTNGTSMKLHPLRHDVVLLAAFLAGGVARQVALGHVRMYGLLPLVGALIGLNLRYNRRSEPGRARIDERYDRIIKSGALVGFVAMLYATVGYAFYASMNDGSSVSEEPILLSVVGLVSIVLVSGYHWLSPKASN